MYFKSLFAATLSLLLFVGCSENQNSLATADKNSEKIIAFQNVNLVPMTTEKIIRHQTVLIKGTSISAIGASNEVEIPENTMVIDGAQAYLMPGLADMHMHTRKDWLSDVWPVSPLSLYLANGVTTIRCFGETGRSPDYILRWRDEINKGNLNGPTIYTSGQILYGPVENPQREVREQKNRGFDFIKMYSFVSKDEFHQAITTAKESGIYTAGHIPFSVGLDGVLLEGMDEIAHIEELDFEFFDFDRTKKLERIALFRYILDMATRQHKTLIGLNIEDFDQRYGKIISAVVAKLQAANIPICTTLVVSEGIVNKLHDREAFLAQPENKYFEKGYLDAFHQGKEKHQVIFRGYEDFARFKYTLERLLLQKLKKAGIPLLLSTDAGTGGMGIVPGFSIHDELRILTENGFTPYEAIVTGTVTASNVIQTMTGEDDFGTIEVGKRADFILVNKNPLEDVANIKDVRGVMASGSWYDKATLEKMIAPGIPVTGAIQHVHEHDNSSHTHIDIIIGKDFAGKLPDAIESVTVTGPKVNLPISKDDFTYIPQLRDFWIRIPGSPAIGTYTFKVTSGSMSGSDVDSQSVLRTIPVPNANTFWPAEREKLTCKTPTFSWAAVESETPLYYCLEIKDMQGNRIYRTRYIDDMLSIRLPPDLLQVGQTYRWRVRIADGPDWIELNNRSHSPWLSFTVGKTHRQCKYAYRIPKKADDGWETSSLTEEGIDPAKINELMSNILNRNLPNVHSVLLVKNGKLVLEEYFNGYGREIKQIIASVTKSVTSILVGIAIDKQMIGSINEKIYEFFPEYRGTNWIDQKYEITLKHVLTMTAGVNWDEVTFLHPHPNNPNTLMYKSDHPIRYVLDKKQIEQPGSRWRYNSGLTVLLGGILKNTTGLYADKFAEKYLFKPLRIADYQWNKHPDGTIYTNGDLYLKLRDMAKIGYIMLNQGKWGNKQIVSNDWIHESTREHIDAFRGYGYGYQWRCGKTFICDQEIEAFWASGTGGQKIYVFPKLDLVVVFTSKTFDNDSGHDRNASLLANFIIPAIVSPEYKRKVIKLDNKVLDTYAGEYKINQDNVLIPDFAKRMRFIIFREGSKLFVKLPDGQIVQLFPESKDLLFGTFKDIGQIQFRIIRNENGAIKHASRDVGFRALLLDKVR